MVELEGIEPSAGISVRRDRHAIVSPTNAIGPAFVHKTLDSLAFFIRSINISNLIWTSMNCVIFLLIYNKIVIRYEA